MVGKMGGKAIKRGGLWRKWGGEAIRVAKGVMSSYMWSVEISISRDDVQGRPRHCASPQIQICEMQLSGIGP